MKAPAFAEASADKAGRRAQGKGLIIPIPEQNNLITT